MPSEASARGKGKGSDATERSRSRSPRKMAKPAEAGAKIQFYYTSNPSSRESVFLRPVGWKPPPNGNGPSMVISHGWTEGTLAENFDPSKFDAAKESTWPLVKPSADLNFCARNGTQKPAPKQLRSRWIRSPQDVPTKLSFALVRWGGPYSAWMDEQEANDGDWGKYGSPPSDEYMAALLKEGVFAHPDLVSGSGGFDGPGPSVEVLNIYVRHSRDVWELTGKGASHVVRCMKGKKRTSFWMLWPAEWEDTGDPDFACYIDRQALFMAMRSFEAASCQCGFPHSADLFERITSKSWMADLSLHPLSRLPACVLTTKDKVLTNCSKAAQDAMDSLHHIRALNPLKVEEGEPACPSAVNKDGITKGVVKLGWSWENRFVSVWNSKSELEKRLKDMMSQPGCTASSCIVQEWVDFDFEMRQYYLPPHPCVPGARLTPTRIECNAWGTRSNENTVGQSHASFSKLSADDCIKRWNGDEAAWEMAKERATEVAQFLLAWLQSINGAPVTMIRLDFMCKRTGDGKARVIFGEYCEMGACCLGWKEGPPTIWKAALDAALRH